MDTSEIPFEEPPTTSDTDTDDTDDSDDYGAELQDALELLDRCRDKFDEVLTISRQGKLYDGLHRTKLTPLVIELDEFLSEWDGFQ